MPQETIFTGLSDVEKTFILNIFSRVQLNVTDENAVEICSLVKSISDKFKGETNGHSPSIVG